MGWGQKKNDGLGLDWIGWSLEQACSGPGGVVGGSGRCHSLGLGPSAGARGVDGELGQLQGELPHGKKRDDDGMRAV